MYVYFAVVAVLFTIAIATGMALAHDLVGCSPG